MKTVKIRECGCGGMSPPAAGGNTITGCKILGKKSKNGREYTDDAMRKAVPLYEGLCSYFDHTEDEASPRRWIEKFGRFANVSYRDGDGLYGDYTFNPKHLYAETFRGWLETDPNAIGFSHNAVGKAREDENGTLTVSEIVEVISVDLVADPATTKGLFEHTLHKPTTETMDPLMTDPVATPAPAPTPTDAPPTLDAAIASVIAAIMADKSLTPADRKKKVLAALKIDDSGDGPGEKPIEEKDDSPPADEMDDAKAEEWIKRRGSRASKYIRAKYEGLRLVKSEESRKAKVKGLCKARGLDDAYITDAFVDLLMLTTNESSQARAIDERRSLLTEGTRPVSSPPPGASGSDLTVDALVNSLLSPK